MLKIERKMKENAKTSLVVYIIFNYPPLEADTSSWRQSCRQIAVQRDLPNRQMLVVLV